MSGSRAHRVTAAGGAVFSAVLYAVLMFWPLLVSPPGPLRSIRTFAWHDQLGYLSMVANVADGDVSNTEPVTETGVNHYPRFYYTTVGLVAHALHLEPITAWNAVSLVLQVSAVVALSLCLVVVSRRAWAGFLAPLPFFAGVLAFSSPLSDLWFRPLDSHAVLWGPYGVMFSNNGETAGICIIVIATSALAAVWLRPRRASVRVMTSIVAMLALGGLSSFQTYSFLSGAYVVAYVAAALFLTRPGRRRWWIALTLATFPVLFVAGPLVSSAAGQLPALVFGLLPAVPGLVRGLVITRGLLAVYAAIFAAAALPQIVWTFSGVLQGDPFLSYRVASNVDLGVIRPETLVASTVVAVPLLVVLALAIHRRAATPAAVASAGVVVWVVLATNDVWGANAEPYRFWIDCFLFGGILTLVAGAALIGGAEREAAPRRVTVGVTRALAVACAALYAVGLVDFVNFTGDPRMSETWNPDAPRAAAATELARSTVDADDRLLLVDTCMDDRTVKATSGAPMAFYYLGMAWPTDREAIQAVMDDRETGSPISSDLASDAGVGWVLRDSACPTHIEVTGGQGTLVAERSYGEGQTLQLWRLP